MATTSPGTSVSQRTASLIVVAMLAMIAVPAGITLHTVRHPATLTVPENLSPYGCSGKLRSLCLTAGGTFSIQG